MGLVDRDLLRFKIAEVRGDRNGVRARDEGGEG